MSYRQSVDRDGCVFKEWGYWEKTEYIMHREDGPAFIICYPDGSINMQSFRIKGKEHREDGPAHTSYYKDGSVRLEIFSINGKEHRELGPARTEYFPDGKICYELFYLHGIHLGHNHTGFWRLWDKITDEQRKHPNILKCLARYL
jgi:hypothetical protein